MNKKHIRFNSNVFLIIKFTNTQPITFSEFRYANQYQLK